MGHRTRDGHVEDDEDDLLGDDLGEPPVDVADEALPRPLVDDELLDELDSLVETAFDHTLDEFVIDPALLRDDAGTDLPEEPWTDEAPAGELPSLPWRARAALPELGLVDVATVLDPTLPASVWVVAEAPARPRVRAVVVVGGVRGEVELVVRHGSDTELRLGRDWLAGRALVDPGAPAR